MRLIVGSQFKKRWTRKFSRKKMAKPGKYGRPTRSSRRRKRSFKGNQHKPAQTTADKRLEVGPEPEVVEQQQTLDPEQHTEPDPVHELEEVNVSSASGKKLKLDDSTSTSDVNDCNVIVNIELLKNVFEKLCRCPDCGNAIKINHNMKKKNGLAHMLDIVCHLCEWKDNFCTSKTISKTESKRAKGKHTK